jgi:hypothetical protein
MAGSLIFDQPSLEANNVGSLQTLGAFLNGKFNFLTFLKRVKTLALDGRIMNEYVLTLFLGDETKTLGVIKPFYGANKTLSHNPKSPVSTKILIPT